MKSLKKEEKETDIECDKCGRKMLLRWERAASTWSAPENRNARTRRTSGSMRTGR
jgi:ssDNA-binding Zn-finger/Zn-ribbon topoisomerase 1